MKPFFTFLSAILSLAVCAGVLSGCSMSPRYGIEGNTFYNVAVPRVQIHVDPTLKLVGTGGLWADFPSREMQSPMGRFVWSAFADDGQGPVTRAAHTIVANLPDAAWEFEKETWPEAWDLSLEHDTSGGKASYFWTEHIVIVDAEADWFSAMLRANGRKTPRYWLGKRWSTTVNDSNRIVAEYREPAAPCIVEALADELGASNEMILLKCRTELNQFIKNSNDVFVLEGKLGEDPQFDPAPQITMPDFMPGIKKLVGVAQYSLRGEGTYDIDD